MGAGHRRRGQVKGSKHLAHPFTQYLGQAMRRVFFSFDWDDVWKANQIRNSWVPMGNFESAGFADAAEIEQVKRATHASIKRWIDKQLDGTSVTCVLIGSQTSNSKWVNYEIRESIEKGNGLLGIYIHNVKDKNGRTSYKGEDPFSKSPINFVCATKLTYPCCFYYDWVHQNGYRNLGFWIERAAQQAGR